MCVGEVRVENPKCEMLTLLWLRSPDGRRRHRKHSGHHYQAGEGYGKWGSRSKVGLVGVEMVGEELPREQEKF